MKRNPSVLNTSGGTNTSASQPGTSGDAPTGSHDKGIGGSKVIALAAENSNLKSLIVEVTFHNLYLAEMVNTMHRIYDLYHIHIKDG